MPPTLLRCPSAFWVSFGPLEINSLSSSWALQKWPPFWAFFNFQSCILPFSQLLQKILRRSTSVTGGYFPQATTLSWFRDDISKTEGLLLVKDPLEALHSSKNGTVGHHSSKYDLLGHFDKYSCNCLYFHFLPFSSLLSPFCALLGSFHTIFCLFWTYYTLSSPVSAILGNHSSQFSWLQLSVVGYNHIWLNIIINDSLSFLFSNRPKDLFLLQFKNQ